MANDILIPDGQNNDGNPFALLGWRITISAGRGPFGKETTLAVAEKSGITISAAAWRSDIAMEMIRSMICQRENRPSLNADAGPVPKEVGTPGETAESPRQAV